MAITLTERAADEVRRVRDEQNLEEDQCLRIGVAGGGCGGFSYTMGFDTKYDASVDSKYSQQGLDVVVDKKSSLYLDGTTIDWCEDAYRRGFTFDNPNAVRSCSGCGGGH